MLAVGTHPKADIVVSAAVGVVGLEATYEAVKLGKTVALSNKEVLVAAGELGHGRGENGRTRIAAGRQRAQRGPSMSCAVEHMAKCNELC